MEPTSSKTFAIQHAPPKREQLTPVLLIAPMSPTVLKPHDQSHYYHTYSLYPTLFHHSIIRSLPFSRDQKRMRKE